ncbi:hypothetical protein [Flavobacterium sp. UBA7680]|uniref:hypothetical protein n=1 Tax=Flavobacterium sp. UBA7680 TaxID=1946559 RepID=UPI0025C63E4F|nr:hypothetical protein [Flavobacterium sp. UBA7680]
MNQCYNCGIPLSELKKNERTKEHIPARALFEGYPIEYRNNRKTVPACFKCNNEYSTIDDYIRDLIGITNESDSEKKELTAKTVRKMFKNKGDLNKRMSIKENSIYFNFNMSTIDKLHLKNFKGIYTLITKKPLDNSYKLDVYSLGHDEKKLKLGEKFLNEIKQLENWDVSGHENVFKFKMVTVDVESLTLTELVNEDKNAEPEFIMCGMEYNSSVVALVVAMKENMQNYEVTPNS